MISIVYITLELCVSFLFLDDHIKSLGSSWTTKIGKGPRFPESQTFEEFMETRQNEDLYSNKPEGKKCISCFGPAPSLGNCELVCALLGRTGFFSRDDTK